MVSHRMPRRFTSISYQSGIARTEAILPGLPEMTIGPSADAQIKDLGSVPANDPFRGLPNPSGFRHFMQATGRGISPADLTPELVTTKAGGDEALRLFKRRIRRLALAMSRYRTHCLDCEGGHDNPAIPAGYTYLLQFIAHDLVASSTAPSEDQGALLPTRDTRLLPLRLDGLYGAGPNQSPLAYEMAWPPSAPRGFLRLGPAKDQGAQVLRDVPRQFLYPHDRIARKKPSLCQHRQETLLADPRNDDNGILSQLVTLFILLHNMVLEVIEGLDQPGSTAAAEQQAEELGSRRFETARAIVTLIYRRIVREDVLSRILHPDVLRLYRNQAPSQPMVDDAAMAGDLRPVMEFTLAAFRFGHAMLRESYTFRPDGNRFPLRDILDQSSQARNPIQIPPTRDWLIAWSQFFPIMKDGQLSVPQPSRRIQPGTDLTQVVLGHGGAPYAEEGDLDGLEFADLLSGGLACLWRLEPLVAAISAKNAELSDLIKVSALLSDPAKRRFALEAWMHSFVPPSPEYQDARKADIAALAEEPPLAFFLRFEASWPGAGGGNRGTHLGVLGSILVAESIFGALHGTAMPEEAAADPIREAVRLRLGEEKAAQFKTEIPDQLDQITSIGALIQDLQLWARPEGPSLI